MATVGERGSMELIADFAYPLPVGVFCEMLGFPEEDGPRFRDVDRGGRRAASTS